MNMVICSTPGLFTDSLIWKSSHLKRRSDFLAGLKDGIHTPTTAGQWKQIGEDEVFKRYLLYSIPSTAKTINERARETRALVNETTGIIKKEYDLP